MIAITNRTSIFMEQIPKIRFSQFDNKWSSIPIGNLAKIKRGASPRPIQNPKWFDENSDIGWLRISDVTEQNGRIKYLEQKISKLGQEKTRVLNTPHLLLSIAATVGKPVVNYVKTGVHDGFLIFENPKFDREFMFQWFDMFRPKWNKYGQPGSQVNLNSDIIRNHKMMIPPLPEQTAIGSLFRTLDDLLASYKDNLANYQSLKATMLSKMFPKAGQIVPEIRLDGFEGGWKEKVFSKLVKRVTQSSDSDSLPKVEFEDIISGQGQLNKDISSKFDNRKGIHFKPGYTLYGKLRPYLNNWLLPKFEGVALGDFWVFDPNGNDSNFIYYLIQSNSYQKVANDTSGTKMPRSDWKSVSSTIFAIPQIIAEQQAIGAYFSNLDNLINSYQEKISQLETLKKKLLQDMFI